MAKYNLSKEKELNRAINRFEALVKNGATIQLTQLGKMPKKEERNFNKNKYTFKKAEDQYENDYFTEQMKEYENI